MAALNFLDDEFPEDCLYTCGLKIYTTLDLNMQRAAEEAVATQLDQPTDPQAAVVTMTPDGGVRAMVGGWQKCKGTSEVCLDPAGVGSGKTFVKTSAGRGFNYATGFPGRQAGSSFKPFTLLAAIEEGISPRSRLSGRSPAIIEDETCETNGQKWEVDNYGGSSYGSMDLIQATTNSVNTIYAQLVAEIGPDKVVDTLDKFGFNPKGEEEITPVCSLALGTYDVTPLEMTRAYAGFAGRGAVPHVNPIRYVTDSSGNCLAKFMPRKGNCERVELDTPEQEAEQNSVDVLNAALETVVTSGTAQAANIGRPAAGKTGTTQNNANAWFAGYTPQLATVVWVGYPFEPGPDGKFGSECGLKAKSTEKRLAAQARCGADDFIPEMRYCSDPNLCRPVDGREVTGGFLPAQIWGQYMASAVEGMPVEDFTPPSSYPSELIEGSIATPTAAPSKKPDEEDPEPEPSKEPEPVPSSEPSPEPSSEPTVIPSPQPTASGAGRERGRRSRGT